MSSFPGSPHLLKGGIVLLDPDTGAVQRIIALQYNPNTLTRTHAVGCPFSVAFTSSTATLKLTNGWPEAV